MKRLDCLAAVYDRLADCAVITNMGAVAAELHALGHRPSFFYLEHAMGLASSMGLGVALAQPERKVVVLDGDGSVLMNLGTFTTLARYAPRNLVHVIFDNERLLSSIDGFPTATATGSDLAAIARAAGIANACTVGTVEEFKRQVDAAIDAATLACVVAKIDLSMPASFHLDLHLLENRFAFARALRTVPS
jgi:sulfopyruvate decarboxylase subunit beta